MKRIRRIAKSERGIWEPVKNEEDIVSEIRHLLTLNGAHVYRVVERIPTRDAYGRVRGRCSDSGIPDLQGFLVAGSVTKYAVPFWIEVKGAKGQLRPAQSRFLGDYQGVGLFAFMARSWEEVKASFAARGIMMRVG